MSHVTFIPTEHTQSASSRSSARDMVLVLVKVRFLVLMQVPFLVLVLVPVLVPILVQRLQKAKRSKVWS
ncbi:hypothetical protein EYF80_063037 [Liparis tanakae]|uniref:Uncharacterized protein n=1 Tax=Liparis tanakae TaxID=230148 RepID=A0A4Z2EDJ6_9TELE|nr:hypothetical protein EYF80_063037 [Liparis tanakae]